MEATVRKRTSKRIPVSLEAELISSDKSFQVIIGNISKNGVFILISTEKASMYFKEGTKFKLKFQTPFGERFTLHCETRWFTGFFPNSLVKGIGLEIISPSNEYKNFYQHKVLA